MNPKNAPPLLVKTAILCNKAGYGLDTDGKEKIFGDPTEIGLLEYGESCGYHKNDLEKENQIVQEFPFDSERKKMSIVRLSNNQVLSYVK